MFAVPTLLNIWSYKYSKIYGEYEYMAVLYGKLSYQKIGPVYVCCPYTRSSIASTLGPFSSPRVGGRRGTLTTHPPFTSFFPSIIRSLRYPIKSARFEPRFAYSVLSKSRNPERCTRMNSFKLALEMSLPGGDYNQARRESGKLSGGQ